MKSDTINSKQAICLMTLFIAGNAMITGNASWAKRDAWISLLAAGLMMVPFMAIYARISSIFPRTGFFDAMYTVFGKPLGFLLCLIITLYALQTGVLAVCGFTQFVHVVSLKNTPQIFMGMLIALVCAYAVRGGLPTMGRAAFVLFPIVGVTLLFTVIFLLPGMDYRNLLPIMSGPVENTATGALAYFAYPLSEAVLLLAVAGGIKNEAGRYRIFLLSLCWAGLMLMTALLRNLMTFGGEMLSELVFPSYEAAGLIEVSKFIQRIEAIISGVMVSCVFIRICICVYVAAKGLAKLCGGSGYREYALPAALLIAAMSPFMFDNAFELTAWIWLAMKYTLPLQAALPLIIWAGAEVYLRRRKAPETDGGFDG